MVHSKIDLIYAVFISMNFIISGVCAVSIPFLCSAINNMVEFRVCRTLFELIFNYAEGIEGLVVWDVLEQMQLLFFENYVFRMRTIGNQFINNNRKHFNAAFIVHTGGE